MSSTTAMKVKLISRNRSDGSMPVIFDVTPDLTENRNVNYKTMDPVHMPGAIHVYNNTSSRTYSIGSIKLISRTRDEATYNLDKINQLRAWTMPRFGFNGSTLNSNQQSARNIRNQGSTHREELKQLGYYDIDDETEKGAFYNDFTRSGFGAELLGSPPAVLELSAYADSSRRGNVYKVPTVITNLSIPYPSDVDYIPTTRGTPFPVIMTIDIQLVEVHSPRDYSDRYNLEAFRRGELLGF